MTNYVEVLWVEKLNTENINNSKIPSSYTYTCLNIQWHSPPPPPRCAIISVVAPLYIMWRGGGRGSRTVLRIGIVKVPIRIRLKGTVLRDRFRKC
jgi:hypothetical protein